MESINRKINIGAVVVLYYPDEKVVEIIKQYPRIDSIILIDNSAQDNSKLFQELDYVEYIPLKYNSGIATAMNKGIRLLIKKGIDYVITMDQDSQLTENVVNIYRKYLACHKDILALTPQYLTDRSIPKNIKGTEKVKSSLQSGTLFDIRIFEKIGYFDDKLFIEVVDLEFFLRMNSHGIPLIRCNEAVLQHHPAITHEKKIGWKTIRYGVASPLRYYYGARNLYYVFHKYHSKEMLKGLLIRYAKVLLLFDDKKSYLKSMNEGIHDARNNVFGKRYEFFESKCE
ncbi:MAG: glycosyltransferase [Lachnospiraceae bacterium]|nr:glycosyltransferase [Lachnospiraceae bacterium]MDD7664859.1 glycosyltransferase [Lachnospiraceae bacterium]MDY4164736.1 glycosyltransferase [Lachnospiraceae bacterium]